MRISKSLVRPTPGPRTGGSPHNKPQRPRSSFDNLVIAHRTRMPSSRVSQIEPIDFEIARSLLDAAAQGPDMAASLALDPSDPSDPRVLYDSSSITESDPQRTRSRSSGEFYIRQHSRTVSWAVGEPCTEDQGRSSSSSSMDWRHHELGMSYDGPNEFADAGPSVDPYTLLSTRVGNVHVLRGDPVEAAQKYNALAEAHGLEEFYVMQDFVSFIVQKPAKEGGSKMWRSVSLPQLRNSPPKPPQRSPTSLYEICLLGGVHTLELPAEFSLSEAPLIPCSLAALGSYIVKQEGPFIPGIFREEGSGTDITALVEYYTQQPLEVRAIQPPSDLTFTVLEVATAYKRVIKSLPGSLLGSLELLGALGDISSKVNRDGKLSDSEATKLRVHLIALALSCVHSTNRFSVICATLGLYAWIGHAAEETEGGAGNMNCRNLSRILGPLLVGRELNDIKDDTWTARGPPRNQEHIDAIRASNASAITIAFMLLSNWKEIVKELRIFAATAAAILRDEEEEERLADAPSIYTLPPRDGLVEARRSSDALNESAVAGKSSSNPLKAFGAHLLKNNVHKKTNKHVDKSRIPDSPRTFGHRVLVPDGTGGSKLVTSLHNANNGNKTRAATSRTAKHRRPQMEAVADMVRRQSVYPHGPPDTIPAASGPNVPYHSANRPLRSRHIAIQIPEYARLSPNYETNGQPQEETLDEEIPSEDEETRYPPAIPMPEQTRPWPILETHGQPQEDYLDEEIPSEDRYSKYEDLLSEDRYSPHEDRYSKFEAHYGNYQDLGETPLAIRTDSYSDLPYVENFEDVPTPRTQTTTDERSSIPFVEESENKPTLRGRSMMPKPLNSIGRSRRKEERSHSLSPSPGPSNAFQQRPPVYHPSGSRPKQDLTSGALHPAGVSTRRPFSPIRFRQPSNFFEDSRSAKKVEPSDDLSRRMITRASSMQSGAQPLDESVIDDISAHPMVEGNNTLAHNLAGSRFSQPRYTASQDGDDELYAASIVIEDSANMDGVDNERRAESVEYAPSVGDEVTEEEPARQPRTTAERKERYLRQLMDEYDDWKVGVRANNLKAHGHMSIESLRTMTSEEFIHLNEWDVEVQGPLPKRKTRAERRMDEDTDFLINHRRPWDSMPSWEAGAREEMQPFIDKVRALRKPKSEATLAKELEDFADKFERCRVWQQGRPARKIADEAERERWRAQREAYAALSADEKRALNDRKKRDEIEAICRESDEQNAAEKELRRWRKRKERNQKSGDSGEPNTNGTRGGGEGGKITALKRLFGGGNRKRS